MDQRQRLRNQIDGAASEIVHSLQEVEKQAGALKDEVKNVVSLDHHMEVRPYAVVGAAFGVGFLAGLIFP